MCWKWAKTGFWQIKWTYKSVTTRKIKDTLAASSVFAKHKSWGFRWFGGLCTPKQVGLYRKDGQLVGQLQKCSDRFYDTCLLPNPEVATHEISLEACKLACELEQTVGFCDWFIFSPHDYQSCKMFTKSLGDLENVLDGRCFKKVSNSFQ